ncbi:NAD-specific glutamate dehydrogenase [Mycobacterium tuberculosis]|nr:NAD-specific glutamate dehydrogenase [Mycobacterium tuberculosis]
MNRRFVFAQIDTVLFFELGNEIVDDDLVKIVTAQTVVPTGRFNFEEAVAKLQNRNVERTASKVVHENRLILGLLKTVSQSGRCRFVYDPEHLKTCNFTRILCRLTLAIVEISRYGNHRLRNRLTQIRFCIGFQFLKNHGRNFLRRIFFIVDFLFMIRTHVTLDGNNCAVRIRDRLTLCRLADDTLPVLFETYYGWSCTVSFRIRDNDRLAAFHNGNARVCRPKVDTNYFTHEDLPPLISFASSAMT